MNEVVTADRRRDLLESTIANLVSQRGRVESQGAFQAVVLFDRPVKHLLHALLTFLTLGLWAFVWIVVAITSKPARRTIFVNEAGVVMFNDGKGWIES